MLADGQALRTELDSLHRRAKRMLRHAWYDRELDDLTSRSTELLAAVRK
jgi:hypothetical protein